MPLAAIESGPDASDRVLSQLQSVGGQPVAWTNSPLSEASHRAILTHIDQSPQSPDVLIFLPAQTSPLASVLNRFPVELAALSVRAEWIPATVYWPGILATHSHLPGPGEELLQRLLAGTCAAAFGELPDEEPAPLPELAPRRGGSASVRAAIAHASLPDGPDGIALRAGLYQLQDLLDDSHECSQSIEGVGTHRNGDYWHAIMHRREPDAGNAKYWFRRVGQHPVFPELARWLNSQPGLAGEHSRLLKSGRWDPCEFVDLCETVRTEAASPRKRLVERIQFVEMVLLLERTAQDAGVLLGGHSQLSPYD